MCEGNFSFLLAFFLLCIIAGSGTAWWHSNSSLAFPRIARGFSKAAVPVHILSTVYESFAFSKFSPTLVPICLFGSSHPSRCKVLSCGSFDLNAPRVTLSIFSCVLTICIFSGEKSLLKLFANFFNWAFVFFYYWITRSLYIFWTQIPY